jgi:TrmH family RNA methyltransferase
MSISNATIKFISSLQRKKFRQNYHKFTAEGSKIIGELLLQQRYTITELYATGAWFTEQGVDSQSSELIEAALSPPYATGFSVPESWQQRPTLKLVTEGELKKISALSTPNQVLAVVQLLPSINPATSSVPPLTGWSIYLDGLQSPANLGAILRVADWFGFQHVISGPGTVDLYNPKSIQATMGCFLRLECLEMDLADLLAQNPDLPVYAADLTGQNIYNFQPPKGGILVIGNEGKGIRPATRELVSDYLLIPRGEGRAAESLNAAVAAGILCGQIYSAV